MKNNQKNRGNYGSNRTTVERNHQNRYYHANESSDIYESEFQNEEEIYDDDEDHIGRNHNTIDADEDDHYQDRYSYENDHDSQFEDDVDRDLYEHQRSNAYVSNNPNRLRKPSKRRFITDAERRKRRRNHLIMENLGVNFNRA
jgi:hypothetical protein